MQTTAQCDTCHTTNAWTPARFDHSNAAGTCSSCHNGSTATGKPGNHFVTTQQCDSCHTTSAWKPVTTYRHLSANYPDHGSSLACRKCHTSNNERISWPFAAYQPDCAACHAGDFEADEHKKVDNPRILYTAGELKDCSGSCHEYTDSSLTTIRKTRTGEHSPRKGDW